MASDNDSVLVRFENGKPVSVHGPDCPVTKVAGEFSAKGIDLNDPAAAATLLIGEALEAAANAEEAGTEGSEVPVRGGRSRLHSVGVAFGQNGRIIGRSTKTSNTRVQ